MAVMSYTESKEKALSSLNLWNGKPVVKLMSITEEQKAVLQVAESRLCLFDPLFSIFM